MVECYANSFQIPDHLATICLLLLLLLLLSDNFQPFEYQIRLVFRSPRYCVLLVLPYNLYGLIHGCPYPQMQFELFCCLKVNFF